MIGRAPGHQQCSEREDGRHPDPDEDAAVLVAAEIEDDREAEGEARREHEQRSGYSLAAGRMGQARAQAARPARRVQ